MTNGEPGADVSNGEAALKLQALMALATQVLGTKAAVVVQVGGGEWGGVGWGEMDGFVNLACSLLEARTFLQLPGACASRALHLLAIGPGAEAVHCSS